MTMTATHSSDDLPPAIGKPALRALNSAGIRTLAQVALRSEADLAKLHGVGPKALGILKSALAQRGASLRES
jgi:DNA-directed RNA polymerase alpha subunit